MEPVKNKLKIVILLIVLLLIGILFVLDIMGNICPLALISNTLGEPIIVTRERDLLFTGISQVMSDENNIYILFGTYSVVQVYSHEGEYKYTISVYNHVNGRTEIAVLDNHLYIRDKAYNIYVFHNGNFVEFIPQAESENSVAMLPYGISDPAYSVHLGSILKSAEDGNAKCVIHRPLILSIYQNNLLFILQCILIMIAGFILFLSVKKKYV